MRLILLAVTHLIALAIGFASGIYALPILTAPASPDAMVLESMAKEASFNADFTRDLKGSDFLHWGEGRVSITAKQIVHQGELSPGPDYKLYLTKSFVEDEAGFEAIKADSVNVGDIKTFNGFLVDLPEGVDPAEYNTVLVWCETFGEFITAAKYR